MDQRIENLIFILQQCRQAYAQMLPILNDEKKAALGSDTAEMQRCALQKDKIVTRIQQISQSQEELLLELSTSLNCPRAELTLAHLAEKVGPHQGAQLISLRESLQVVLSKVRMANDENQLYINHILRVIRNGVSFFNHACSTLAVYGSSGSMGGQPTNHGLILSNSV